VAACVLHVGARMAYVIAEPCVGTCDTACVRVCPVDAIHGPDDPKQLYIDPEACICCAACEPICPVNAIFEESDVPEQWRGAIAENAAFFVKRR
jgi:ferredoxin